ncbi:MAG TPA: hypothetical protein VGO00_22420, partial [Kofleriaceae bacterium]|nr:hypothetical protein [Kofleriaceae bacterium]
MRWFVLVAVAACTKSTSESPAPSDHVDHAAPAPAPAPGPPASIGHTISVRNAHVCVRTHDGHVSCWGRVSPNEDPILTPRVEPDFDNVVGVSTSMFDTCAWRGDGTVACKLRGGKLETIAKLDHVDEVAGDQRSSCARHAGKVSCWTVDDRKQPIERSPATEVAGISDAVQIAVAAGVACLRRATGDVSCWDPNATPGDDGKPPAFGTSPSPVPRAKGAVSLVGGGTRFAALLPDGTSYGWDWQAKPWTLPAGKLTRIAVGESGVCVEAAGAFRCIEEWDKTSAWVDMPQIAGAVEIAVEGGLGCARLPDSRLRCWGFVDRLGIGQALLQTKPVEVAGIDDATAIAGTDSYATCALHKTGRVSCWGTHLVGKLDTGKVDRTPVDVGLDRVTSIDMGMYTACAHTDDHKLRCWGQRDDNTRWDTPTVVAKHPRSVDHGEPNMW